MDYEVQRRHVENMDISRVPAQSGTAVGVCGEDLNKHSVIGTATLAKVMHEKIIIAL